MPLLPVDLDETTAKVLHSSDNLNNITKAGNYTWSSSSRPANTPFTSRATMNVNKFGVSDGYVLQTVYSFNKIATRSGDGLTEMGNWYIHFDKEKIKSILYDTFYYKELGGSDLNSNYCHLECQSGAIRLIGKISISAGTYTCDGILNNYSDRRFLRLAHFAHNDVKNFFRNCGNASTTIDNYAVGNHILLGAANIINTATGKWSSSGALYLYRRTSGNSGEWDLCSSAFVGTEANNWKITTTVDKYIQPCTGACNNEIICNSYDPTWD